MKKSLYIDAVLLIASIAISALIGDLFIKNLFYILAFVFAVAFLLIMGFIYRKRHISIKNYIIKLMFFIDIFMIYTYANYKSVYKFPVWCVILLLVFSAVSFILFVISLAVGDK